jgi:hypothetical protein
MRAVPDHDVAPSIDSPFIQLSRPASYGGPVAIEPSSISAP